MKKVIMLALVSILFASSAQAFTVRQALVIDRVDNHIVNHYLKGFRDSYIDNPATSAPVLSCVLAYSIDQFALDVRTQMDLVYNESNQTTRLSKKAQKLGVIAHTVLATACTGA